jgi:hypothetical protein
MEATMAREDARGLEQARHELAAEHRGLAELMTRVRQAQEAGTLATVLEELHGRLKEHFAHEEFPGGLYQSMGALAPEYAPAIRDLVDEHFQVLASIRSLTAKARGPWPSSAAELLGEVAALIDRLSAHEAKEMRLAGRIQPSTSPQAS